MRLHLVFNASVCVWVSVLGGGVKYKIDKSFFFLKYAEISLSVSNLLHSKVPGQISICITDLRSKD